MLSKWCCSECLVVAMVIYIISYGPVDNLLYTCVIRYTFFYQVLIYIYLFTGENSF